MPLSAPKNPSAARLVRGVFGRRMGGAALAASVGLAGCASPLAVQSERELRRSVIDSTKRELAEAQRHATPRQTRRELDQDRLGIEPALLPDLERMAGPRSYEGQGLVLGEDLLGRDQRVERLTLERAVRTAVERNLPLQFARLQPAIVESQVVAAQAAFDAVLFSNLDWSSLDQPRPSVNFSPSTDERQTTTSSTGIRRALTSGGQFVLQQDLVNTDLNTPGQTIRPSPSNELSYTLRFDQPLLRGFGSDVTLAQVRLARNAERDQISQFKRDLVRTAGDTERAYWELVRARQELLILQRLYERGLVVRDQVLAREALDATPAQKADARARVERRWADVIRAQRALRDASDALKALLNDPDLPVGGETLVLPVDEPVDAAVSFSLADVLTTAIRQRPELQQAILSIDNTSIRQQVADNARLPRLDLRLQTRFAGLDSDVLDAFDQAAEREFVDYLVGVQFEQPLGNRAAEAQFRQRRLERQQATIAYRNAVQQVVQEAKRALRSVVTGYELIEQTRITRLAETENLRSLEVEKRVIRGFDVNALDLEFRRQEALAQAEREEIGALVDFQNSITGLYAAMGTLLDRNNIELRVPGASEALEAGGLAQPRNPVSALEGETPRLVPPRTPWRGEPNR